MGVGSWKLEVGSYRVACSIPNRPFKPIKGNIKNMSFFIFYRDKFCQFSSLSVQNKTASNIYEEPKPQLKIFIFRLCKKLYYPKVWVRNCSFLNVKLQFPTDWIPEKWANSSQDNTKRNFALVQHVHWICKVLADFIYWVLLV